MVRRSWVSPAGNKIADAGWTAASDRITVTVPECHRGGKGHVENLGPAGDRDSAATEAASGRLIDCYRFLDRWLESRPYLAGDDFTMADIPAGATLYRYYDMEIERPELKHLGDWYKRLSARPAYRAHVMVSYDELRA